MRKVVVLGVGMTPIGKFPDRSLKDLAREAVEATLSDAGISKNKIEAAYVGSQAAGLITGQYSIVGQSLLRPLGIGGIPIINTENACASGCSALHLGWLDVASGFHDCVLVLGVDKLYTSDREKFLQAANSSKDADAVSESKGYGDAVGRYAERARNYMKSFGLTKVHLAKVSSKNHCNAALNPYAQYRKPMSVEEVLASPVVVEPLHRAMIAPVGDGGATAILCSLDFARRYTRQPVFVVTSVMQAGGDLGSESPTLRERAASEAYERAGVGPSEVGIWEVSDATVFTEIMGYWELGLCHHDEAVAFIDSGAPELKGRCPVNPSGGLESKGHPFGASGIAQVIELVWQLRGQAGQRQVSVSPKLAFAEVHGGWVAPEAAAIGVAILKR